MPPATRYKPENYLPYIDGLRGISVLTILLFHIDVTFFRGGFIGVDIFFVISGYLITTIIAREIQAGKFSFAGFYARRIKRIFPALFAMLLATSIAALFFLGPQQFSQHFKAVRFASGQISNFYFSHSVDYFAPSFDTNTLLHTWSLGVEEQFYLLWPLLLILTHRFLGLKRSFIVLTILLVASLATSEYLVRTDAMAAFYLLHSRMWELALGGIVALNALPSLKRQTYIEALSAIGLLLIVLSSILLGKNGFPGLKAVPPCLGAALIIYAAKHGKGYAHKILSFKPLIFTGLISYSLYLWHWPLIAFYKNYFAEDLSLSVQVTIVILSFILAYLSFRFIEQPARVSKATPLNVLGIGLSMIILFIVSSNLIKNESKASWRVTYDFDKRTTEINALDKICSAEGGAYNTDQCLIGPNKGRYEVILTGDSFASHYADAVLDWAKSKDLTVRLFMRGACQTWVKTDEPRMKDGKHDTYCEELSQALFETLKNETHIKYVFLAVSAPQSGKNIRASLKEIQSYDKAIYFLGSVPIFKEHPHYCQIKQNLLISKILPQKERRNDCFEIDHAFSNAKLNQSLDSFIPLLDDLGIPYFDPRPFLETAFDADGHFLYADMGHINSYGAMHLAPHLRRFIEKHPR